LQVACQRICQVESVVLRSLHFFTKSKVFIIVFDFLLVFFLYLALV
jgi:hypothetical protein